MNKQSSVDYKLNGNFNLGDPKKMSTQELEQIVFNNLKSAGEKLQSSNSPIKTLKQLQNNQDMNYENQRQQQNQNGLNGNYQSIQVDQQQKTLPINRNTPSFSNVIINDSLITGNDNNNNINNDQQINNTHQIQLSAFASPQFNSPSQKLLFSNTNRGDTMSRRDLENSNQVPMEMRNNQSYGNINSQPQNNPFQSTDQLQQVQNLLSTIENPFSQNLFASQMKNSSNNNTNSGSVLPNINTNPIQKYQLLPPKQLETPNKQINNQGVGGVAQKLDFQRNVSDQNVRNPRYSSLNSNKENSVLNSQSATNANAPQSQLLNDPSINNTNKSQIGQQNIQSNLSASQQKLRSVSPTFNGWSDSTSPAIAGAMKVLKDKYVQAESQLKELQQTCEQQKQEITTLKEQQKSSRTQWEENQKESFVRLSEQTSKVLGEITKLQSENAHVQNENAIMQKQIDAYKIQIQELTQEVLYLKKCNDIIEGEKNKHLEHNALEKDEQDQKYQIMDKLRRADKSLIDKLENDLKEYTNFKYILEERLKKVEIENDQLKNELYESQESLEGRCRTAESKLSLYEKELNLTKEKYEKERNFNQKRSSIYAEKDARMKQIQEENIDLRSQVKSLQSQLDNSKKSNDKEEKHKQKLEREKYAVEESFKQLKGITEEIAQLAQREGNQRVKEQVHLALLRVKRLDDATKKTQSDSSSVISYSTSKSKITKSRGPSKESKSKEASTSRTNNFSASKGKTSVGSSSANKFYKQASPRSNKNGISNASTVTVVSNKKIKSTSKQRTPSQKVLQLEDLDESIESRRSALNYRQGNNINPPQKKMSRKSSLVFSQNNSLDYDTMSPNTGRGKYNNNNIQTNRSTSRQRSVSKNSDYSAASKSKSQSKRKQNYSQISQQSMIYHEDRGSSVNNNHHHHHHEEDDIDNLMTNQSQITVKPSHSAQSNSVRYGNSQSSNNQQMNSQSSNLQTEPKNISSYIQSYSFPENFEKMSESEISNEIFKLERAIAETKREYNNLLAKSREKGEFNIEEMRARMNELAIDMQKQSDWQFVLKKKQREIITMSFGKQSQLQTNFMN